MSEEREKVRCQDCELVQWRAGENCRRCGTVLPEPIVKIVERVVEQVVFCQYLQCPADTEEAPHCASAALTEMVVGSHFPTMAEVERTMILVAYRQSIRKALVAARLLGIGKTTFYRKLRNLNSTDALDRMSMSRTESLAAETCSHVT